MFKKAVYHGALAAFSLLVFSPRAFSSTAEENYGFHCVQCHGVKGKGDGINAVKSQPVQPRDHTNPSDMAKLTDDDIINVIRRGGRATGKSTMMPPYEKTLSDEDIFALKDYLRSLCGCVSK